jgi:predicted signal transduction protein with EAL and GGDEF domain
MSHERIRLYERSDTADSGDGSAISVLPRSSSSSHSRSAAREIDTLRSINAHLLQQIALLKEREAQAQRLADRDGLTGLYNRRRMSELLGAAVVDARQRRQRVGLLFVDLMDSRASTMTTAMRRATNY